MMETWRAFGRLKPSERSFALEAAFGLTSTWFGLHIFGFRNWKAALDKVAPLPLNSSKSTEQTGAAATIARIEAAAARHLFFTPTCLVRSLVLAAMLRRRGLDAQLRIGARKEAGQFEAHAWVELDGNVLNAAAGATPEFVPFEDAALALRKRASAGGSSR
jgi:hypothetical protein